MKTLKKTMDNEVKMKMIVIHRSKIMLLIAPARAWELLITVEATRTGTPCLLLLHRLTIINTCIYRNKENTFRP